MAQARSEGNAKTRVVILFGGRSAEHEISLLSARNIVAALDRDRFTPFLIGIDKQGRWHLESQATLDAAVGDPRTVHLDAGAPLADATVLKPDDVVFPALHGTFGEDGTLQGLLELAGVAYVGAPVLGSAVGMDKDVAKRLLRDAGIPVVPYRLVTARAFRVERQACLRAGGELGFPLICRRRWRWRCNSTARCCSSAAATPARSSAPCWATTNRRRPFRARSSSRTGTGSIPTTRSTSMRRAPSSGCRRRSRPTWPRACAS